MSKLQTESAKFIYKDGQIVAMIKGNGTVRIYKVTEASYSDVDDLFDTQDAMPVSTVDRVTSISGDKGVKLSVV